MRLAFVLIFILSCLCFGSVSTKHENSIGIVMENENPLMYKAGSFVTNSNAVSVIDGNLNLRIRPMGTYMLFDESVLLCGMPTDKFDGVVEPFVLTYERRAHHAVQGLACHNLVRVDSIKPKGK